MPRAKGSNKKGQTKAAAAADVQSVQDLELGEKLNADNTVLPNGSITEEDIKNTEVKVTKRSSGRGKKNEKVVTEVTEEKEVPKKPAAKGRSKKKVDENEVINENKNDLQIEKNEDAVEETIKKEKKLKGKGAKKATMATKKTIAKAKETEKETPQVEIAVEEPIEETKSIEKKSKTAGGRKKKQETEEDKTKENDKALESPLIEAKKSARSSKKIVENTEQPSKEEPPKKKRRSSKKDAVEESVVTEKSLEAQPEVEKKPTKRGRAAASKAATKANDSQENDASEDVLPKKRSRKAPSVEKEIVEDKPKRGRGKKTENVEKPMEVAQIQEKEEIETNGQVKLENIEEIEESKTSNEKAEKKPITARGGRKRAAPSANKQKTAADDEKLDNVEDVEDNDEADGSKSKKSKKKTDSAPLNATTTKYNKDDFDLPPLPEGQTAEEPRFNLKISSWNVAGLRSWLKKEGLKYLEYEQPDIFCMQEIKCTTDQLPDEVQRIPGYHPYWLCMPGGHAGVAIYSKIMPINVEYGIGNNEFDDTGRIITAEYEKFFLVNVYVPNSGRKLVNLESRMKWEKLFQEFIQNLNARKPVVICGDMNVSHQEHDLANPKTNTRNAGFTKEERDKMTELLSLGFIDTFRHLYPERKGAYTFWTYMGNARSRNVGWRLDYFIVSERFINRVVDNCMRSQCMGSDHCPITLFLKL